MHFRFVSRALEIATLFYRVMEQAVDAQQLERAHRKLIELFNSELAIADMEREAGFVPDDEQIRVAMRLEPEQAQPVAMALDAFLTLAEDIVDGELNLKPQYEEAALRECPHLLIPRERSPERYFVQPPLAQVAELSEALDAALAKGEEIELFGEW